MEVTQENELSGGQSEDENEMNTLNVRKVRKNVIDSDSETEDLGKKSPPELAQHFDDQEETPNTEITKKKNLKRITMLNSDSEEENCGGNNESVIEEEEISPHNKSFPDEATAVEALIYTTNSKGELIQETATTNIKKSRYSLYDSDSSEEETTQITTEDVEETELQPRVYRKSRRNDDKPKKMTAQEAAKQKIEIQSESQRMLRESNVSLPYHKPKSYSIREFLEKRAKLASALPLIPKAPPSVAIKMTKDQLEQVSKKLDERIKEVEEFYKSDESEEEAEEDDAKDAAKEIRSWLDFLIDKAVDSVESKMIVEECNGERSQDQDKNHSLFDQEEPMECSHSGDQNEETNLENSEVLKEIEEVPKKANTLELLKDKLNLQPRLSGTPDDIIDLEEGVTKPNEIKKLVEKYLQHTAKKVSHKHKVCLDVLGVGKDGEIIKETVSMNVDDEEEEHALIETPGAKLQRLREELQVQMTKKRLEMWKQKQDQGDILLPEKKITDEDSNTEKDILDDEEEEFEMTESESEDDEGDEEEYELKPEKPKAKSAFLDEEAEEDDPEEINEDDEETGMDIVEENEEIAEENDENDADDEAIDNEDLESPRKKVLRRIVKPFTEDSDDEETESSQKDEPAKIVKYYTTDDDDFLPPNLPRVNITTPQRPQIEKNKSEFEFLTPVTYLTGLQNLNSDSKSKESPKELNSPSLESEKSNSFSENFTELPDTQGKIEELAELCSGKFPETQKLGEELPPTTQELLNVCSGDFGITDNASQFEKPPPEKIVIHTNTEIKSLDEDQDQIISQLLDEDEFERFKKKFESPINPIVRKTQPLEDVEEVNATGLINSDDENEGLEVKKKKRQKKLVFSDEEEDSDDTDPQPEEEEIDLHDNVIDDEEQQLENEVAAQESSNFKLKDFLDQEAELSESEWGSADEDEKGLDELDFEEGDEEKFNEKKMRTEIERIHMRQMLDEDNREVKLLQELLLEDGELHGTGRKRQFRWKTLDSQDNGEFDKRDDDDIFLDEEEESEEHFRKMRHKREMFLKKKVDTDDDDSILGDSQILNLGQKMLKIKSSTSQSNTPVNKETEEPFGLLLSKRGSFLTRKDHVLQRLAEYNKVTTSIGSSVKNSKCFVFQTAETSTVRVNNNKRKAAESTPIAIKKLRLDDLSPAVDKKGKNSRGKKLFGNW